MSPTTGTTMIAYTPERTRELFALTTDGWASNVAAMTKHIGAPALFAGATTAVDQWANVMSWALKAQRKYVTSLTASATAVTGLSALNRSVAAFTPPFAGIAQRREDSTPRAEIESALRVEIRQAEERRVAEAQAAQEALIAQAKVEQAERDRAVAEQDARTRSEQAQAAREKAAHEESERVKAELAQVAQHEADLATAARQREERREAARQAEAKAERERLARNAARRDARKAARAKVEREEKAATAEAAARKAARVAAREEAAATKAAHAARAAERAAVRRTARAAYVGRPKAELVSALVGRGLPKSGNVPELIERLVDADVA